MACTCGASGAIDGHSPFCGLRAVPESTPRLNRVVIGLPERLENAKSALRDYELMIVAINSAYVQRGVIPDNVLLDRIGDILND